MRCENTEALRSAQQGGEPVPVLLQEACWLRMRWGMAAISRRGSLVDHPRFTILFSPLLSRPTFPMSSLYFLFLFPLLLPPSYSLLPYFPFNFLPVPSSLPSLFLRPEVSLCIPVLARMWPKHKGSCLPSALFLSEGVSFSSLGLQGCDLTWVVADMRCIRHLGGSAPPTRLLLDTYR